MDDEATAQDSSFYFVAKLWQSGAEDARHAEIARSPEMSLLLFF
jgi:hypothetical protein